MTFIVIACILPDLPAFYIKIKQTMQQFDHIIVGTGQATGTLFGHLVPSGDTIAVIEGGKVGGSCVNYGCTPTKTLVASAKAYHKAQSGATYGFESVKPTLDYAAVRQRMNEIRYGSSEGLTNWMESTDNVTLFKGWATFVEEKVLEVEGNTLKGNRIYINVGTRPMAPPIKGLNEVTCLDSAGVLDLEELPEHLIIIGGGYIGMEFAQVYKRFGSKVTVIQRGEQVMPKEDKDVAETIKEFLEKEGVKIHCNAHAHAVKEKNGGIELEIEMGGQTKQIEGSHLMVAAGRKPNSDTLSLEKAGIKTNDHGFIEVNEYCETNVPGIFAVGDVNGKGAFTHTSVNDAEIVISKLQEGDRKLSDRIPIYALFTDPPLGRVGMTEKEALEQKGKVLRAIKPMSEISRAKEMSETTGFAKLLVDADTDLILGAAILGPGGDEIINMFATIMHSNIPCRQYRKVALVHPTVSELMPWVLDGLELVEK
jgi:pyruvate/2-oxoglutarate dehydrogenase complex dihydrolipoamide dehydrogenase (E3) component